MTEKAEHTTLKTQNLLFGFKASLEKVHAHREDRHTITVLIEHASHAIYPALT